MAQEPENKREEGSRTRLAAAAFARTDRLVRADRCSRHPSGRKKRRETKPWDAFLSAWMIHKSAGFLFQGLLDGSGAPRMSGFWPQSGQRCGLEATFR